MKSDPAATQKQRATVSGGLGRDKAQYLALMNSGANLRPGITLSVALVLMPQVSVGCETEICKPPGP